MDSRGREAELMEAAGTVGSCAELGGQRPTALHGPCLSQGFYFCTNIMTKKQVGEERVY